MKKISALLVGMVMFVGCTNIRYDALQYDRYVSVYEKAEQLKGLCEKEESKGALRLGLRDLKAYTSHMNTYAEFRVGSPEVAKASKGVALMVAEIANRYDEGDPSVPYCVEKMTNIKDVAKTIAWTLGAQQ